MEGPGHAHRHSYNNNNADNNRMGSEALPRRVLSGLRTGLRLQQPRADRAEEEENDKEKEKEQGGANGSGSGIAFSKREPLI